MEAYRRRGVKTERNIEMIWYILTGLALIVLIFYFKKGKNAVWGAFTISIIVGLIWQGITAIIGDGFKWEFIFHIVVIGVLAGFSAELLGVIFKRRK